MIKKYFSIVFLAALGLGSCTNHMIYLNRPEDQTAGKSFLYSFYAKVRTRNFKAISQLASDTLTKLAGKDGLSNLITKTGSKLGEYQYFKVLKYNIRNLDGDTGRTVFQYKLGVHYANGRATESIEFEKLNRNPIRIYAYNISTSDAASDAR